MKILGVDSTATAASAAVLVNDKIVALNYSNTGLTHSQTLLPMIEGVLKSAGVSVDELDCIAVSNGPGSFTGVRIGVSAVKGIAQPLNIPCVSVSTTEVIAKPLEGAGCYAVSVMDARCNQVYTAQFDCSQGFERITPDEAITIDELGEQLKGVSKPVVLIGDGTRVAYNKLKDVVPDIRAAGPSVVYQSAADVCAIAAERLSSGEDASSAPHDVLPNYLRLSQAERELKKKNNN
ncbi:MAG: tRNA (adenosine(37)-N6)-threonylcarbamoyltransferase complex dimerization subunit type 1 TsaB [Clostridia bacterium]|nr:tRNA (adenosine(37)-N6)-threonylcarbamoyltransferase complex dimerization subunit type 1 TsaB [Clostridia bacterium]